MIHDALAILWPDGVKFERLRLLVTDAAAYMKKAGKALSVLFPTMVHVTCLAHGLHNVSDHIRMQFPAANSVIAHVKACFVKAPLRVQLFKEILPDVPLPPEPVLTRWGTWLAAASYYAKHWDDIVRVFEQLNEKDAASIRKAKALLASGRVRRQFAFIDTNYSFLVDTITKLETQGLPLVDALYEFNTAETAIRIVRGSVADSVAEKLSSVREKNVGLVSLSAIAKVLSSEPLEEDEKAATSKFGPTEFGLFRFAPVVSCDVERVFSRFKCVLRCNRERMTIENLRWHLISYCNA